MQGEPGRGSGKEGGIDCCFSPSREPLSQGESVSIGTLAEGVHDCAVHTHTRVPMLPCAMHESVS